MPELSIKQAIELAIQHQTGGRLADAEAIYRQILAGNPNHPDALHLLGAVAFQAGQPDKAVELIRRAIEVHSANPDYHANLAKALIACGKSSDAVDTYAKSLQLRPKSAETWNALGDLFDTLGESNQAIAAFQLALNLQPNFADAWNNLGIALQKTGRTDAAIDAFRKAVAIQPQFAHAHFNLGMVLHAAGRADEASAALRQAASLRPESADVFNALGVSLRAASQLHQAIDAFEDAIRIQPQLAEAWSNLGSAQQADGRLTEAISSYRRAVSIRPDFADALRNLGLALQGRGELEEAIGAHEKAVAVDPNFAAGFNSLGSALHASGKYEQAITAFERAIALRPDFAMAHHNLGLTLLLNGDFRRGWPEHEWRLADPALSVGTLKLDKPKWDGSDPSGKRILLHPEQGFGDAIQFIRYARLLHQRGAQVIVASRPETRRLFEAVAGVDQTVDFAGPFPEFDLHCPLMSLPMMFGTTLENTPADVPYLKADAELSSRWRKRMPERSKVGIAWAGKSAHRNDRNRSLDPQVLDSILSTPGFNFVSLQRDQSVKSLTDWTSELRDFAETAGIIDNLDLVITVDTAVAHLAGAMGKPVWVLLPFVPDWRWLLNRDDSPWYPTMRLFRQPQIGDWNAPINRIVEELTSLKIPTSHG